MAVVKMDKPRKGNKVKPKNHHQESFFSLFLTYFFNLF